MTPRLLFRTLLVLLFAGSLFPAKTAQAQAPSPLVYLTRGQLWNAYFYAKTAAPFTNWRRINYGLDWPGYDPEFLNIDIGGGASHLVTGGIYFSSKDSTGRVIALDDFAIYASSTSADPVAKYFVSEHRKIYGENGNWWYQTNPNDAEDVIISRWRANPGWQPVFAGDRQHPIEVRREVRQFSGSSRDENYILVSYTIKNIADSTLFDAYAMVTYAMGSNTRMHNVVFPTLTPGVRNNQFIWEPTRRLMYAFAGDNPEIPGDETLGPMLEFGPTGREFLAPGYVGLRLLRVSPNRDGRANHVNGIAWMPVDPQQDQQGPFVGRAGFDAQHGVLANPLTASNASNAPNAAFLRRSRTWSLISLGPWDLAPGDSIHVAYAEMVAGGSYADATRSTTTAGQLQSTGLLGIRRNGDLAQLAYDNQFRVPKPPAAPPVEVSLYDQEVGVIANVVRWSNTFDNREDPDYAGLPSAQDLVGYRLYRSAYLPIGPWELVADIRKGDPDILQGTTYTYVDRTVQQGNSYYYALTAYDTGHPNWPVNPAARFPDSGNSNRVPALESSLFANRTSTPFKATIPPQDDLDGILVVPNPFISTSGQVNPTDRDQIQFVNVPSPCVIRIYTMRGTLVRELRHEDGSGIVFWNQETQFGQFVESGVYIYHIETPGGQTRIGRLAIVR